MRGGSKPKPIYERILRWSIPEPNSGCWLWIGTPQRGGYGKLALGKRGNIIAHRASWLAQNGSIPEGTNVLHKCDTRSCVNPDHLFLGTSSDNSRDMVRKGRSARGERNSGNKVGREVVREIRRLYSTGLPQYQLAKRFGLHAATIHNIVRYDTWEWLT